MRTLPQDLSKLSVSSTSFDTKASLDFKEAIWTAVGFVVLVVMLTFLVFVTRVAPRPDKTEKPPAKSKTTTTQTIAEVRI